MNPRQSLDAGTKIFCFPLIQASDNGVRLMYPGYRHHVPLMVSSNLTVVFWPPTLVGINGV